MSDQPKKTTEPMKEQPKEQPKCHKDGAKCGLPDKCECKSTSSTASFEDYSKYRPSGGKENDSKTTLTWKDPKKMQKEINTVNKLMKEQEKETQQREKDKAKHHETSASQSSDSLSFGNEQPNDQTDNKPDQPK